MIKSTEREPSCGEGSHLSTVNFVAPSADLSLEHTPLDGIPRDDLAESGIITAPNAVTSSDSVISNVGSPNVGSPNVGSPNVGSPSVGSPNVGSPSSSSASTIPSDEQAAKELGARWALEIRRSLRLEKRRAAGGWPGTKREAHARATWLAATLQSTQVERSFHAAVVTDLATAVYASAKSTWLANAEEEDEDSDVE